MDNLYFHGFWRMDWGLGNPNKTAILISMLMIAIWAICLWRKEGFWIAMSIFAGLGICLVHTYSRGGLVAAMAGLLSLLYYSFRKMDVRKIISLGIICGIFIAASIYLHADKRYVQGISEEDHSITNRFAIWHAAPRMMVDAPQGWGLSTAGNAYQQWYQPPQNNEMYRTLVNSHLTWLVEFGWAFRFAYIFVWVAILMLCRPASTCPPWFCIPLGVWVAFAIGAFFSSVAESPWLWILPILNLIAVLGWRIKNQTWPSLRAWFIPVCIASATCLVFSIAGMSSDGISYSSQQITVGKGKPAIWILADQKVLGASYGRIWREFLEISGKNVPTIGIVTSLKFLPDVCDMTLVISGQISNENCAVLAEVLPSLDKLIILSPACYPQELFSQDKSKKKVEVFFGEFSQSPTISTWMEYAPVHRVSNAGDFLPNWPEIISNVKS